MIERGVRSIATLLLLAFVVVGVLWSALALWFDGPNSHLLGATMGAGIVAASLLGGASAALSERTAGCAPAGGCGCSLVDIAHANQFSRLDSRCRTPRARHF
jgi:hypothetical protein